MSAASDSGTEACLERWEEEECELAEAAGTLASSEGEDSELLSEGVAEVVVEVVVVENVFFLLLPTLKNLSMDFVLLSTKWL